MITNTHNGYTNYWTWVLIADIDNKASLYNRFHNKIRERKNQETPPDWSAVRGELMNMLQDYANKTRPSNNSFWDSITNDILKEEIDYKQIADLMLDEEHYPKH